MVGSNEHDVGQFGWEPVRWRISSPAVRYWCGRLYWYGWVCLMSVSSFKMRRLDSAQELARAGLKIVHVPQAKIWHKIMTQKQDIVPCVDYYSGRNRLLFLRDSGLSLWRVMSVIFLFHVRVTLSRTFFPRHQDKRTLRKVLLRSADDFLRGYFGSAPIDLRGMNN